MPWLLIILLLMPLLDIGLAISWLLESPLAAAVYLMLGAVVGVLLMKIGSIGAREAMSKLQAEEQLNGLRWMSGFAATWAAGTLLLFPGYLSDGFAVLFLLGAVLGGGKRQQPSPPLEDETLTGGSGDY